MKLNLDINIDTNEFQAEIQKEIIKKIREKIPHKHVWTSVKNSSDVKCKICGIRAKRTQSKFGSGK